MLKLRHVILVFCVGSILPASPTENVTDTNMLVFDTLNTTTPPVLSSSDSVSTSPVGSTNTIGNSKTIGITNTVGTTSTNGSTSNLSTTNKSLFTTNSSGSPLNPTPLATTTKKNTQLFFTRKPIVTTTTTTTSREVLRFSYVTSAIHNLIRDYPQIYCPWRCQNGQRISLYFYINFRPTILCFLCSCERPLCQIYDICCPEFSGQNMSMFLPMLENEFFNISLNEVFDSSVMPNTTGLTESRQLGCDWKSSIESSIYIRSCSTASNVSDDVKFLCEDDTLPANMTTTDIFLRVFDVATGIVYRNKYCAWCNGVYKYNLPNLTIFCKDYQSVYRAEDRDTFLQLALEDMFNCKVHQTMFHSLLCERFFVLNDTYTCSPEYANSSLYHSCHAFLNGSVYKVYSYNSDRIYKNIFCAMCEEQGMPAFTNNNGKNDPQEVGNFILPFTFLFDFGNAKIDSQMTIFFDKGNSSIAHCGPLEWYAPDGLCYRLSCTPGKVLRDGQCVTALPEIRGLAYSLRLWLIPDNLTLTHLDQVMLDEAEFTSKMNLILTRIAIKVKVLLQSISPAFALFFGYLNNAKLQPNFTFWVDCIVYADWQMSRDEFEKKIADDFINKDLVVKLNQTSQIVLTTQVLADDHGDGSFCDLFQGESTQCKQHGYRSPAIVADLNNRYNISDFSLLLKITNLLTCPYVSFDNLQYNVTLGFTDYAVSLNLDGIEVTFSKNSEVKMIHIESEGKLLICKELLNTKINDIGMKYFGFQSNGTPVQDDLTKIALYLCTLCSFAASSLCLILTLVSYLRFSFLRTVAGSSNMFLCVSLMMAQTLLLASSHVKPPSPVCTSLGILTHFTWLWMFMWNFMCSYHMFRVFTAKTRPVDLSRRAEVVLLLRRCAMSLLVPLVIVVTVVCSSIGVTSGESIGYGHGKCYLDSTLLVGVSLIGPLLLILVCNISFFAVTVYTINNIRNLQVSDSVKNDNKRNMYVYVRLSTITGAFWFVAIFAEAFDLDPLRFIAVFLNGFEGVFIFLSYVCNKRVLGLHRQGIKFKSQRSSQHYDSPTVAEDNGQQEANE